VGSRFDDWIYWHFFIITLDYNSSHIGLLLHNFCLTNLSTPLLSSTTDSAESESYVTTDGQPATRSWIKALFWGLRPDFYYCLTVAGLLIWGALSDERPGLSFTIVAGPRQLSYFRVRVP
jgi:hypothetical protein